MPSLGCCGFFLSLAESVPRDSFNDAADENVLILHNIDKRVPQRKPTQRDDVIVITRMMITWLCGSLGSGGHFEYKAEKLIIE